MCDAVAFLPQLLYIDETVSQMALCCVSRLDRRMVVLAGCVGAKAEVVPTMRRADRMARRKRFILTEKEGRDKRGGGYRRIVAAMAMAMAQRGKKSRVIQRDVIEVVSNIKIRICVEIQRRKP